MDQVWWNQITNAQHFINMIADTMLSGKSALVILGEKIPWYETMKRCVIERVKRNNSINSFEQVSSPRSGIGSYLLNRYYSEEQRTHYRPAISYAQFLAENHDAGLKDRFICVTGIDSKNIEEWMSFLTEYHQCCKKSKTIPTVFVLEGRDAALANKPGKGIVRIIYDSVISHYDKYTFCMLAVSTGKCSDIMKPYLAELAATLCEDDVELCAECIKMGREFLQDPMRALENVTAIATRSDGSAFEPVFVYDAKWLNKKIWEAQLKIVFPMIESYRSSFVENYAEDIRRLLPIENSHGNVITEPNEVEIGALKFMIVKQSVFWVDENEKQRLKQYWEVRNKLAHLKTLELFEMEIIMNEAQKMS